MSDPSLFDTSPRSHLQVHHCVATKKIDNSVDDIEIFRSLDKLSTNMIESVLDGETFSIVTHNIGGQTYKDNDEIRFVNKARGTNPNLVEETLLAPNRHPVSLCTIDADIYCFQEYIGPTSNKREDLAIYERDNDNWLIPERQGGLRYQLYERELISQEGVVSVYIYNYHGNVLSPTTSIGQWKRVLSFYRDIIIPHYENGDYLMITGDFNIDFWNVNLMRDIEKSLRYSIKKAVRDEADVLLQDFNKLMGTANGILFKYFDFYPIHQQGKAPPITNCWCLESGNVQPQQCVDYLIVSKTLSNTCISHNNFTIYYQYLCNNWSKIGNTELMVNDFDHAPVLLDIHLKKGYRFR